MLTLGGFPASRSSSAFHEAIKGFGPHCVLVALEKAVALFDMRNSDLNKVFRKENWRTDENSHFFDLLCGSGNPDILFDVDVLSDFYSYARQIGDMVSLLEALLNIALQLRTTVKTFLDPVLYKLSDGLASLPDEILSHIITAAVYSEGSHDADEVVRLSHVSRKFRELCLSDQSLWATLAVSSRTSCDRLKNFVVRSGPDATLEVRIYLDNNWTADRYKDFMRACSRSRSLWSKLVLEERLDAPTYKYVPRQGLEGLLMSLHERENVQYECLQEVTIDSNFCSVESDLPLEWLSTARAPRLRSLSLHEFLPFFPQHAEVSLVTSLTLQWTWNGNGTRFFTFPSSLPSLSRCQLRLRYEPSGSPEQLHLQHTELPLVVSLHLRLFFPYEEYSRTVVHEDFIAAFTRALRMPGLEDLRYTLDFGRATQEEVITLSLLHALLPEYFAGPILRLSSLAFSFNMRRSDSEDPFTFLIPLDRIPSVSSLEFACYPQVRVKLSRGSGQDDEHGYNVASRLASIKFISFDDVGADDVLNAVESLQEGGIWESLESFVIENRNSQASFSQDEREKLVVVGGKTLRITNLV